MDQIQLVVCNCFTAVSYCSLNVIISVWNGLNTVSWTMVENINCLSISWPQTLREWLNEQYMHSVCWVSFGSRVCVWMGWGTLRPLETHRSPGLLTCDPPPGALSVSWLLNNWCEGKGRPALGTTLSPAHAQIHWPPPSSPSHTHTLLTTRSHTRRLIDFVNWADAVDTQAEWQGLGWRE